MADHEPPVDVDEPHDVLAAEEYGIPAPDPELHHHGPIRVPEDPTGIPEPHDVLAADEFPMPASRPPGTASAWVRHADGGLRPGALAALAVALVIVLRRRRRRRR